MSHSFTSKQYRSLAFRDIRVLYFCSPYYNISITGAMVGGKTFSTKFSAVVDSGTSFTALSDPMYTEITSAVSRFTALYQWFHHVYVFTAILIYIFIHVLIQFDKQVKEKRNPADSSLPFEYCYTIRYVCLARVLDM